MEELAFRQIHLDFHTSEAIPRIGEAFDKEEFQEVLQAAAVNSMTLFATCHHGWAYYDGKVGSKHPNLKFDLLREQYDACKEIGVKTPIYLTAGVNQHYATIHPEWRIITPEGSYGGWQGNPLKPGFKSVCFNSPYLDYLCEQIQDVCEHFPDNDGIFIDIIGKHDCCCSCCLGSMHEQGLDPLKREDRDQHSQFVLNKYYQRTTETVRNFDPNMKIFHNSGHVTIGDRDILKYFSHLELESLPTGGWGYDHFPMSAKYVQTLNMETLGMTGKFHTTWGEFGGFKHINALRYECAAMIAFNTKCSIGDQLHPSGKIDRSTYNRIGAAYNEVAAVEMFCCKARAVNDIAILSNAAFTKSHGREFAGDIGAGRILLEGHYLFEVIDGHDDNFNNYKAILLADNCVLDKKMERRLNDYLAQGGKLILSGKSGLKQSNGMPAFDIGAKYEGTSDLSPDFILPADMIAPEGIETPFVNYMRSERIKVTSGTSIGDIFDPYFNRSYKHFCSHQHTPYKMESSGYDSGVMTDNILYFAQPIFTLYRGYGATVYKEYILNAMNAFLKNDVSLSVNLPSTARIALNYQEHEKRHVMHLLSATTISRGGTLDMHGGNIDVAGRSIEVIEELFPLYHTGVALKLEKAVRAVKLQPQNEAIDFKHEGGVLSFEIEEFECSQVIEIKH
ncbi:MAG: beta-galactosidase [Lentisphaeria bacterium]|nr:beta-galactosidase [Lentisphaeria bacterium]